MLRSMSLILAVILVAGVVPTRAAFDDDFTGATMRVDLYHSGTSDEEHLSLERVSIEGPWPGSRTRMLDHLGRGKYLLEVADLASSRILYSRGFATIFGEWETTGEARAGTLRTIPEAVRFPEPRRPVQLRLRKRGDDDAMREFWRITIDPGSRFVHRAPVPERDVWAVQEKGDPATKVDLLILGDGYAADEISKYHEDALRLAAELFNVEPFRTRRDDFNVWAIDVPSERSGVSRPRAGVFRNNPLGTSYNSFDSERYVLSMDDRAWRDVAASAPYDAVILLVNERKYGGGGIYNLYATVAASSGFGRYVMIHEFGHSFAGLGDEYYTSDVAYEASAGALPEPWEPNLTALRDPERLKWADLVTDGLPLPTPWGKAEYEERSYASQQKRRELRAAGAAEERLEDLFQEERELFTRMLGAEEHAGGVGAFEGAGYQQSGLYRPSVDCLMFTRDLVGFCRVCSRAIEDVIDLHSR